MAKRIVAAGHICLDVTPVFPSTAQESLKNLLSPGKLIHTEEADIHTGGSVANTGLAMKILGADVDLVAKIGMDPFGDIVSNALKQYGAEKGLVRSPSNTTSYSVVLAPPGVDRIFLHHPGANNSFTNEDVSDELLRGASLLHFGYPPLMRQMYLGNGRELEILFKRAKSLGVATSLDLAAVDPQTEAGQVDWKELLRRVIPYVDFFVPSVEELCFMLDRKRYEAWNRRAAGVAVTDVLDVVQDVKPLADLLLEWGAKVLLIKCGAPGMYYQTAGKDVLRKVGRNAELDVAAWASLSAYAHSYRADKVLSGTGAGDTSIAAFLISALGGCRPQQCVARALATGACCVGAYDALSGLLPLDELDRRISAGWEQN